MKISFTLLLFFLTLSLFPQEQKFLTHYEKSEFLETANYEEVIRYSKMLAGSSPLVHYESFGTSPQGRELPLLILDKDGHFTPAAVRQQGKVILLLEAGIHPGEADGTDAVLMFARDVAVTKGLEALLDHLTILIIPAFNVDGLARFSPYNRINQNGPIEMGWRATAQNLNLNRDFLKADAPEMQAWLRLFNRWLPDFFVDCHATDGADYQYVATYMMEIFGNMDEGLTAWQRDAFLPYVVPRMEEAGYPVFPYVSFRSWHDPRSGLVSGPAPPRLSQGYSAIQNRPGLLIETHMLKPHQLRVEATYELIRFTAEFLNEDYRNILDLNEKADNYCASEEFRNKPLPVDFKRSEKDSTMVEFMGVEYTVEKSDLTGGNWFKYSNIPQTFNLPWFNKPEIAESIRLPLAYIIPAEWEQIINRLELHGIRLKRTSRPINLEVVSCLFSEPRWRSSPYEGRHMMTNVECTEITESRMYPEGSAIVMTNQRAARVIANILEPVAADSYIRWGFFDAIFEQKEYSETYVMEVMAREMLENDPSLREEFERKVADDPDFAKSQWGMLNWFYSKTPYWDWKKDKYPVGKIFDADILENIPYE